MNSSLPDDETRSGSPYRTPSHVSSDSAETGSILKWIWVSVVLLAGLGFAFLATVFILGFGGMRRGSPRPVTPPAVVEDTAVQSNTLSEIQTPEIQSEANDE